MSRFLSEKYSSLSPYVPGEQPTDMKYIKLNTNESPYTPSNKVVNAVKKEAGKLMLYSDPDCKSVVNKLAEVYGVKPNQVVVSNGSDEIINFIYMAYCDQNHPMAFPDISYGFYPVFAKINNIPYVEIPLKEDFSIDYRDYCGIGKNIIIANPNAPTGMTLNLCEIEEIVKTNPSNVVIIDEAYVDFGAQSAISLVNKYDNLIVVQTFSKSRSLAGGRLGFAISTAEIVKDLNTMRYSTNPYNVNRMTMAAGVAALEDNEYYMENCREVVKTREYTVDKLKKLGFEVLDSKANFIFAKSDEIDGNEFYVTLKNRGILIRHFTKERLCQYNRITIGTREQMDAFIKEVEKILKEKKQ